MGPITFPLSLNVWFFPSHIYSLFYFYFKIYISFYLCIYYYSPHIIEPSTLANPLIFHSNGYSFSHFYFKAAIIIYLFLPLISLCITISMDLWIFTFIVSFSPPDHSFTLGDFIYIYISFILLTWKIKESCFFFVKNKTAEVILFYLWNC